MLSALYYPSTYHITLTVTLTLNLAQTTYNPNDPNRPTISNPKLSNLSLFLQINYTPFATVNKDTSASDVKLYGSKQFPTSM